MDLMRDAGLIGICLLAVLAPIAARGADAAAPVRLTFAEKPAGWTVRGVPGHAKAVFTAGYAGGTNRVLRMTSDNATATFKSSRLAGVDLRRTPIMRWRWKAVTLPAGADGRADKLDDQAIGLYVSTGSLTRQKAIAYRWETNTPQGASGRGTYAAGVVELFWQCIRNRDDLVGGPESDGWHIEEANVADAFQQAFGEVPASVGLGISCNSQFTHTRAEAWLDWVVFLPAPTGGVAGVTNAP